MTWIRWCYSTSAHQKSDVLSLFVCSTVSFLLNGIIDETWWTSRGSTLLFSSRNSTTPLKPHGCFQKIGVGPQNGWFIWGKSYQKWMIWGENPLFKETPTYIYVAQTIAPAINPALKIPRLPGRSKVFIAIRGELSGYPGMQRPQQLVEVKKTPWRNDKLRLQVFFLSHESSLWIQASGAWNALGVQFWGLKYLLRRCLDP